MWKSGAWWSLMRLKEGLSRGLRSWRTRLPSKANWLPLWSTIASSLGERRGWQRGIVGCMRPRTNAWHGTQESRSGPVSEAERARERAPSFRRRYRWRAGIEGRLSSLRRDYGLRRCPDHGEAGFNRHLGWGVIASNLRHIAQHLAATATA